MYLEHQRWPATNTPLPEKTSVFGNEGLARGLRPQVPSRLGKPGLRPVSNERQPAEGLSLPQLGLGAILRTPADIFYALFRSLPYNTLSSALFSSLRALVPYNTLSSALFRGHRAACRHEFLAGVHLRQGRRGPRQPVGHRVGAGVPRTRTWLTGSPPSRPLPHPITNFRTPGTAWPRTHRSP